ncbi:MAG: phasin family protein [Hyphomicrobiales bacterium]
MIKSFEDVQAFGKEGFDAYVASATAMTKGFQAIAAESADFSKKNFEKGSAAMEKILAAKSLDKAVEAQQAFAKEAYESFIGQWNKIGELYMAAAKEAYKPFESQVAQFSTKVTNGAPATK